MAIKRAKPQPRSAAVPAPAAAPTVPVLPPAAPLTLPQPTGAWNVLALLLSLFRPGAGVMLALLYWRSPEGPARRFSRWCLVLALIGAALAALVALGDHFMHLGLDGDRFIQPY